MRTVPTRPFELEILRGRDLCWACKTVLSSSQNSLRMRSSNMSVTVRIMCHTKDLVNGVNLIQVTNCSFQYIDLLTLTRQKQDNYSDVRFMIKFDQCSVIDGLSRSLTEGLDDLMISPTNSSSI